jgi:hypothetical protein
MRLHYSIDGWLVQQPSLVDRRKRALLPVVRERQSLADALVRYLSVLGLERKAKDVTDLASYLAAKKTSPTSLAVQPPVAPVTPLRPVEDDNPQEKGCNAVTPSTDGSEGGEK